MLSSNDPIIPHNTSSGSLSGAGLSHSVSAASLQGLTHADPPTCRTIYVHNIDPDTDDGQLQAMFEVTAFSSPPWSEALSRGTAHNAIAVMSDTVIDARLLAFTDMWCLFSCQSAIGEPGGSV